MQVSIPFRSLGGGGFSTAGGSLTTPLILAGNPTAALEATPKQYVDSKVSSITAESVTSGILASNRFPSFSGDVVSNAGSGVINLNTTGVTAGTYTKLTVNGKGRVTVASGLSEIDIPNINWNKITIGKPTTLAGYGISDGLSKEGDNVSGFITTTVTPTETMHAVNKSYVDTYISTSGGLPVGDVIRRVSSVTPSGFLRCNGGQVSKTEYSALYSIIGDTYSYPLMPGSGQPWRQQYAFNTTQSGNITGWTTGTALPTTSIGWSNVLVTKNRVYLIGGQQGLNVYTAPINEDGTLGTWTTGTSLPSHLSGAINSQVIVTKNRVYLLGTFNSNNTYTATINSDGTLGNWVTGIPLPVSLNQSQAIVTKNRVYLLGGLISGNSTKNIYTAPINEDGTLGSWIADGSLPVAVSRSQAIITKNRVYLLGGFNSSGVYLNYCLTAPINSDGTLGSWTSGTNIPVTLCDSQSIVTKNRVYLLGGDTGNGYSSTVYTAPINEDGTLGTWTTGTSLPGTIYGSQAIVLKNKIYMLGGNNNSTVYTASFSGGLNDYSPYYDGSITTTDTTNFRLPDYSSKESNGFYYYIKA